MRKEPLEAASSVSKLELAASTCNPAYTLTNDVAPCCYLSIGICAGLASGFVQTAQDR
jgi:hypothetical protein